jgi:hypothetical protein
VTIPADSQEPTYICINCASLCLYEHESLNHTSFGCCLNTASDHHQHVIDADHPICERVTWRVPPEQRIKKE